MYLKHVVGFTFQEVPLDMY